MDANRDDVVGFVHLRDLLIRPEREPPPRWGSWPASCTGCRPASGSSPRCPRCGGPATTSRWWSTSTAARPASSRWRISSRSWSARSTTSTTRRRSRARSMARAGRGGGPAQPQRLRRTGRLRAAARPLRHGRRLSSWRRWAGWPCSATRCRSAAPVGDWRLVVVELDGRRVARVALRPVVAEIVAPRSVPDPAPQLAPPPATTPVDQGRTPVIEDQLTRVSP